MQSLTATQLAEWEMYLSIDPPIERKHDIRTAYLASLLTNLVIRSMGKPGAQLTEVKDFIIEWDAEEAQQKKIQTPQQMKAILLGLAEEHNNKLNRK